MPDREPIGAGERLSRLVFFPSMFNESRELLWPGGVFQFRDDKGRRESLVWRKYAPSVEEVHEIGCRLESPKRKYVGAITAHSDPLLSFSNQNGHGFDLVHRPEEGGPWHAEICCKANPAHQFKKTDKLELIAYLREIFSPVEQHSCLASEP